MSTTILEHLDYHIIRHKKPPFPEQSLRRVALRYGPMAGQKEELAESDSLHHFTGLLTGDGVHVDILEMGCSQQYVSFK